MTTSSSRLIVPSCSFCLKSQDSVARLFSNPSGNQRVHICNECVEVCEAVLEAECAPEEVDAANETHPLLHHPLASSLFTVMERWIRCEALGGDAALEFAEFRRVALQMVAD